MVKLPGRDFEICALNFIINHLTGIEQRAVTYPERFWYESTVLGLQILIRN